MSELRCWKCGKDVPLNTEPCPLCEAADPIGFRRRLSNALQAMAVMVIAMYVVQ